MRNRPIIDDEEEIDLEVMDLTNLNMRRDTGTKTHEEAVHRTKEAIEILTAQHRDRLGVDRVFQERNQNELEKGFEGVAHSHGLDTRDTHTPKGANS
ncbi:hypothetical protein HAX54_004342 [Datura stramonium]|uniref:Uncharacterized protein n=1 Tax=Datura stramonium TaxID=4076 RepID=A0ABS8RTT4_DATST|nr:hypothetical protein [Datura stramonium]